jgi:hypothetical protein
MAGHLVVGLSSWIIQDGNYGDFAQGVNAAFAIESYAASPLEAFESNPRISPSLTHPGNACHEVSGRVVYVADDWRAIDVGALAFQQKKRSRQPGQSRSNEPSTIRMCHWKCSMPVS